MPGSTNCVDWLGAPGRSTRSTPVPRERWLPPDHFQEEPKGVVAHRTSPTNIAMHLLSIQAAYDLGFCGLSELESRFHHTLEAMNGLERHRGHFFNWYDTRTSQPLARYVSAVDSGNLAGALLALSASFSELRTNPVIRVEQLRGLVDTLDLILESIDELARGREEEFTEIRAAASSRRLECLRAVKQPSARRELLRPEPGAAEATLHRILSACLQRLDGEVDLALLRDLRALLDSLQAQITHLRQDAQTLLPFVEHLQSWPSSEPLPDLERPLEDLLADYRSLGRRWSASEGDAAQVAAREALTTAIEEGEALVARLQQLEAQCESLFAAMDFSFLYDDERRLLHIGYDLGRDRLDAHYYDLLASEARLASFVAIVKGDVPQEHWYALGRPVTRVGRRLALLSWSATMFEYLMPPLLMKSHHHTLLDESARAAVRQQIAFGRSRGQPWGISESGFFEFDADRNYQYRAFGCPGLGFKRGLGDEVVVTPYASMLALTIAPQEVLENLDAFAARGMVGRFGLYEALDLREDLPVGRGQDAIVRSYMAHHQGMILVAIANHLQEQRFVQRFHRHALVQSGEMLLNEQRPVGALREAVDAHAAGSVDLRSMPVQELPSWTRPIGERAPFVHLLSNGRLTSVVPIDGGGGLFFDDLAVNRWSPTRHGEVGAWLYVHDRDSRQTWSAGRRPTRSWPELANVHCEPHRIEFLRRDAELFQRTEIAVDPADDVEVRRLTLSNESSRARRIRVAMCFEPVLGGARDDLRHPAFSRLFLHGKQLEGQAGVAFVRRSRTPDERTLSVVHHVVPGPHVERITAFADRRQFLGRPGRWRLPRALGADAEGDNPRFGHVLDAISALQVDLVLPARSTTRLAFTTSVAPTPTEAARVARKFDRLSRVDRVFQDAEHASVERITRSGMVLRLLPLAEDLLSYLWFPQATLRAVETDALVAQPDLWRHGISGDFPLLVVRVFEGADAIVRRVLQFHGFWHSCGVSVDVALLNEAESGYLDPTGDQLRRTLAEVGANRMLGQRGGVFLVPGTAMIPAERSTLLAAASVVLDTREGSIEQQLERGRIRASKPPLPPLSVVRPPRNGAAELNRRPVALSFAHRRGGFAERDRAYHILLDSTRRTPAPWCNVLANESFGSVLSESSLGTTFSENSAERRLTPWCNDALREVAGEGIWLRDEESGEVWPLIPGADDPSTAYEVTHAPGVTRTVHRRAQLEVRSTCFVPPDDPVKVLRVELEDLSRQPRRLTLTACVEWTLGTHREFTAPHLVPEVMAEHSCLMARCAWNPEFAERVAFLTTDRELHGFTCDRFEFFGVDEDRARPAALARVGLSGERGRGGDLCGALQVHVDLAAGEQVSTHFVLGEASSSSAVLELLGRWRDGHTVASELERTERWWREKLEAVQVKTPDPALNSMLNCWLLYQSMAARFLARSGFYQSSGAIGFRDQLQDAMAFVHVAPDWTRRHLLAAAAHQFEEGDVLHWWHPPGGRGVRTRCSDDLLWLPYVTAHYVRSTGDHSVLEEDLPFLVGEPLAEHEHGRFGQFPRGETASLREHCIRALERGVTEGEHGLPNMGGGDWNDGMDRVGARGVGESVWLGWFAIATIRAMHDLLPAEIQNEWTDRAERIRRAIEKEAWDGAWYRRAFHDDGSWVGSSSSLECTIDSLSQSWAALSGAGAPERVEQALRSAWQHLVRESDRLVLLLTPPFDRTRHDPGYIRAYPPGVRENGGQYTHAAAWLGLAHVAVGDGDRATRILELLNPLRRIRTDADVDRYRVEPYVLAADVYGIPPHVGLGGWTWYTGAAAWMWRLGVEGILGLQRVEGDLRIDPCLPRTWERVEATVRHPEGEWHVVIENPNRVSRGIAALTVDGSSQTSNRVPRMPGRQEVRVQLGEDTRAMREARVPKRTVPGREADPP